MSQTIDKYRRSVLKVGSLVGLALLISPLIKADELTDLITAPMPNDILAVRIWPSSVYTRITLEAKYALQSDIITQNNVLLIHIHQVRLNKVLQKITAKILSEDPIIANISVTTVDDNSIVIKVFLRQNINVQTHLIPPLKLGSVNYQYRYVIDMYPASAHGELNDDILALLQLNSDENNVVPPVFSSAPILIPKLKSDFTRHKKFLVMLDPGHGGEDPGAIGFGGTKEKDVVLEIAQILYDISKQSSSISTQLTRNTDIFIPLGARVAIAKRAKADLFISIHADAFTTPVAKGSSVFILSDSSASNSAARWLAKTQNDSDLIGGMSYISHDSLTNKVLLDMTQTWTNKSSTKLAQILLNNLAKISTLHSKHVERAGFAVLKSQNIPSVLVETAFISNPQEEILLDQQQFRHNMAQTIFNAINLAIQDIYHV